MRIPVRPGRRLVLAVAGAGVGVLAFLLAGVSVEYAVNLTWAVAGTILGATGLDYVRTRRAWKKSPPGLTRRLPSALAIGVRTEIELSLENSAPLRWRCELYDHVDTTLLTSGLPLALTLPPTAIVGASYTLVPLRRGLVSFAPAHLRVLSRWGLCELLERSGVTETRRVYPDFAQIARYAWLAGDRRLQEIGIKTYQQRGEGTDFKQLSDYRYGDPVRHIDWKATMRRNRAVIREFQDERDQYVLLLIDCGRRMRADDRVEGVGTAHFDQVLNAVMLLAYVALKQGDAVGAMTFGTPAAQQRAFPPRKGTPALSAMMSELYALQPTPTHSDYVSAAQEVLRRQHKRALVIVITNFRDEDSDELAQALRLLRSRHLVLLASLRERVVRELMSQPVVRGDAVLDIAGAHMYERSRRSAFNRLAGRDALMVDAEPDRLGIELVNRYHAAKRAGLI